MLKLFNANAIGRSSKVEDVNFAEDVEVSTVIMWLHKQGGP
jgi:hypothetical protein